MLPIKIASQSTSKQTEVVASTSSATNPTAVRASNEELQTLLVTSTADYPLHLFAQPQNKCTQSIIFNDEKGRQIIQKCTPTANSHQHSVTFTEKVESSNNPLPPRVTGKIHAYIYDQTIIDKQGAVVGFNLEETVTVFYEDHAPVHTPDEFLEQNQQVLRANCTVQHNHHIHSLSRPIFLPFEQNPIPSYAFAFKQYLTYAAKNDDSVVQYFQQQSQGIAPRVRTTVVIKSELPASNQVRKKLKGKEIEKSSWRIPEHWDILANNVKKTYIQDIVDCYDAGMAKKLIAKRHEISHRSVIGLLWLAFDGQRLEEEIANFHNLHKPKPKQWPNIKSLASRKIEPLKRQITNVVAAQRKKMDKSLGLKQASSTLPSNSALDTSIQKEKFTLQNSSTPILYQLLQTANKLIDQASESFSSDNISKNVETMQLKMPSKSIQQKMTSTDDTHTPMLYQLLQKSKMTVQSKKPESTVSSAQSEQPAVKKTRLILQTPSELEPNAEFLSEAEETLQEQHQSPVFVADSLEKK